jgi:hypothetical protein
MGTGQIQPPNDSSFRVNNNNNNNNRITRHTMTRWLGGPQRGYGRLEEDKKLLPSGIYKAYNNIYIMYV